MKIAITEVKTTLDTRLVWEKSSQERFAGPRCHLAARGRGPETAVHLCDNDNFAVLVGGGGGHR